MTHKLVKFGRGKRYRRLRYIDEDYERGYETRRPVLLSCDDVQRMAIESSRARLISHLVSKANEHSMREYTSYNYEPTSYDEPPYSCSPYPDRMPMQIEQVLSAYPSIVEQPQWCPYAPSSHSSEVDIVVGQKYICKCGKCRMKHCPGKYTGYKAKPCTFKDNIMTFCDRYTMTQKLNDTACGRTPTPSRPKCTEEYCTEMRCPPSLMTARDTEGKLQLHEMYSRIGRPVPILKKCCNEPCYDYDNCPKRMMLNNFQDDPALEVKPLGPKSPKYVFKPDRDRHDHESDIVSRKNLYNEGISDKIANKFPVVPKKMPSPPDCSKTSLSTRAGDSDDNYIPHSHRSDSKYHACCKKPTDVHHIAEKDNIKRIPVPSPKIVCKKNTAVNKTCKRCKEPPRYIKLPKRVLTSEKVVEVSYADKNTKDATTCRRMKPCDLSACP